MIYIEFISRRPSASLKEFYAGVAAGQDGWAKSHPEDRLVLNIGRTWRLGPEPEYLGVWWTPSSGFDRIDYWDKVFRSGAAEGFEDPFQRVARIDAAGCYEPLMDPVTTRGATYYAEYFRMTGKPHAVRDLYEKRVASIRGASVNLLVHRIGKLAPEPGGLAIMKIPTFASLSEVAAGDHGAAPIEVVTAGTYADVGREIL